MHGVIQGVDGGFDVAKPEASVPRVARPTFTSPCRGYLFGADHKWLQGGACSSMQAAQVNGEGRREGVWSAGGEDRTDLHLLETVEKLRYR